MPVKPFTLIGDGMLVTVGALMPGGVLPPAAMGQTDRDREKQCNFSTPRTLWKTFTLTGHLVTLANVRRAGPVGR